MLKTRNLEDLFGTAVLLEDIENCGSKADRERFVALWQLLDGEIALVQKFKGLVVEIWRPDQQSEDEAASVLELILSHARWFDTFSNMSSRFISADENVFAEALAYVESLYEGLVRIAKNNLRVANGKGRRRDGDCPDDFIGPTGYIGF